MSDRLARAGIAVVENTSSRVDGIRLRLGGTSAEGLKMKKEPTARNSIWRYARDETSWDMRVDLVWIIWGERAREYERDAERPATPEGCDMLAELKMDEVTVDDCSDCHASASCKLNAASGPP